jgi:acetyltransferase-like isoleucine patch superfamily enzyme
MMGGVPRDYLASLNALAALRLRQLRHLGRIQANIAGEFESGPGLMIRPRQFPVQITVKRGARLTLGRNVYINQGVNILATASVTIGDYCRLADLATIYDTDSHPMMPGDPVRTAPVVIGRNVWIGRSAMVLPGVTIGDHAVIAAGAVVTRDVEERTLVAGIPATVLRRLDMPPDWVRP